MARRGRSEFDKQGYTYFVTTTVLDFISIFNINERYYQILIDSLKYLIKEHDARLIAYVLMPNHLHLVLYLPEGQSLSDFMRDFKKYTSVMIKRELLKDGYQYMVDKLTSLSGTGNYKLWMDRFDDVIIISEEVLKVKTDYIHFNPVRAGLVKKISDWKYSSTRNYYLGDNSVIEVTY